MFFYKYKHCPIFDSKSQTSIQMKQQTILTLCLLFSSLLTAQNNVNDWIDFSKTYYKFQVEETGIYKIPYTTLQVTGINLEGANFKLFYQGKQIPIYVSTNQTFTTPDYIEFYGQKNDGTFDTQLYATPNDQAQDYTSLFTDKSTYFLVSDNTGEHQRILPSENNIENASNPETHFIYESVLITDNTFHFGKPYSEQGAFGYFSNFDTGEGWVSSVIQDMSELPPVGQNTGIDFKIPTKAVYTEASETASLETKVVGRNKSTGVWNDKQIEISLDDNVYVNDFFSRFNTQTYQFDLTLDVLETEPHPITGEVETKINFKAWDGVLNIIPYETKYSVAYCSLKYPRQFKFDNTPTFAFELNIDGDKYFEVSDFEGGSNPILYDLSSGLRIEVVTENDLYKFKLEPTEETQRQFFITASKAIQEITELNKRQFTDYSQANNQGDFIIITHPELRKGGIDYVEQYEIYRSSEEGGNQQVIMADINELYDQYAWGIEKHPMSIKNFVNDAIQNWDSNPQYLLLLGKGVRYNDLKNNPTAFEACLIPSYGYTASDLMFTTTTTQDYYPQIAIGRIPAKDGNQVRIYLDKIKEYEAWQNGTNDCNNLEDRAWMNKALHIAKGWGEEQTDGFQNYLDIYENIITQENLNYELVKSLQDTRGPIPSGETNWYFPAPEVPSIIEEGVALINYFGHSSPYANYWQFDLQHPNNYDNEGKYPFIISNSAFVGTVNAFADQTSMAEDYVLRENRGAIGFLGSTTLSKFSSLHLYTTEVLNQLYNHPNRSIGQNVLYAIQKQHDSNNTLQALISNEFAYTGDPSIKLNDLNQDQGCTDASASNYNPKALCDNGTCQYNGMGCTDPCAPNYRPNATQDDGSCQVYNKTCNDDCSKGNLTEWDETTCSCQLISITTKGCTNPNASNYNPIANCEDDSCLAPTCPPINVIKETVCDKTTGTYTVVFTFEDTEQAYLITNNQTGSSETLSGGTVLYGPFAKEDLYDYTIAIDGQTDCQRTFKNNVGDCLDAIVIRGCTESCAPNFNLAVTEEDGSCEMCMTTSAQQLADNTDEFAKVYPNPSTGTTYLSINAKPQSNIDITLYSLEGKTIKKHNAIQQAQHTQHSINLRDVPNGTYLLIIQTPQKQTIQKTILQR